MSEVDQERINKSIEIASDLVRVEKVAAKAPWLEIAEREYEIYKGKKETSKEKIIIDGQTYVSLYEKIQEYYKAAKYYYGKDRDTAKEAWCASFVAYCIQESGFVNSSNPSCGGYDWGPQRKENPKRGWRDGEGEETEKFIGAVASFKPKGGYTHAAILVGKTNSGNLVFLGGNQNSEIRLSAYSPDRIYKYMKPVSYEVSEEEYELPIIDISGGKDSID